MNIGSIGLGNRPPLKNWEYANAAARTGATGFVADDIGKFARQADNGTYWELTAVTPTWAQFGGGAGIQVEITVGAETGGNTIEVSVQVKDIVGNNASEIYILTAWLSDSASVAVPTSTAPSGGFAVSDGDTLFTYTANKVLEIVTSDEGLVNLQLIEAGADTWYLWVKMPDGTVEVSSAITFA